MVTQYSLTELFSIRQHSDVRVNRSVRKVLFTLYLWLPARDRELLNSTIFSQRQLSPSISISQSSLLFEVDSLLSAPQLQDSDLSDEWRPKPISVVNSRRVNVYHTRHRNVSAREVKLVPIIVTRSCKSTRSDTPSVPSLYVLNAAALSKPGAVEQLAADLKSYSSDVGVITETHLKDKHADNVVAVDGYSVFRRDRAGRKGGGVAVYARSELHPVVWNYSCDDRTFELLWIITDTAIVGALYHPPRPTYQPEMLLNYLELSLEEIVCEHPEILVVLAGDFNQLSDQVVSERTGLMSIVHQPTRGDHILDRVYVSSPSYGIVRVVTSVVRSDHKAIVAYAEQNQCTQPKISTRRVYRKITPTQHALFLQHAATVNFELIDTEADVQSQFDRFYSVAFLLLDYFYPVHTVSITSRDPPYVTAYIKAMLRQKNRLMRKGRIEEASALAQRIGKAITKRTRSQLSSIAYDIDSKELWSCVRRLTGKKQSKQCAEGITAESLNEHYSKISTDDNYSAPQLKHTVSKFDTKYLTEWQVFKCLDGLQATSTGLDNLPAWFLRVGAPIFSKTLTELFNLSLTTSTVPFQWKQAWICPVPKISVPSRHADYRPISITPVLTRILEKLVVRNFIYPALLKPPETLSFSDQYAYRPTGSTTAAIIDILHTVTHLLVTNPYVVVIALDFSKAFDTVRHSSLLEKIAKLDIQDIIYNWLVDFFTGHSHQTRYKGKVSEFKSISASIIQGSGVGPTSYVVNASDLHAITGGNVLCKYADDTYLIVPAVNVKTRPVELQNITDWATANNLTLNLGKSEEIIFNDKRRKQSFDIPSELTGLRRVHSMKILGVTISNGMSVSRHVDNAITACGQTLYALRVLRAHGMNDSALQLAFRAVILARLLYASPAWWGFASARDLLRLNAFLRRCIRVGFCSPDLPDFQTLCCTADQKLFTLILGNPYHVLYRFLPPTSSSSQFYSLRPRAHDKQLPDRFTHLTNNNFIIRMLFSDVY